MVSLYYWKSGHVSINYFHLMCLSYSFQLFNVSPFLSSISSPMFIQSICFFSHHWTINVYPLFSVTLMTYLDLCYPSADIVVLMTFSYCRFYHRCFLKFISLDISCRRFFSFTFSLFCFVKNVTLTYSWCCHFWFPCFWLIGHFFIASCVIWGNRLCTYFLSKWSISGKYFQIVSTVDELSN